MSRVPEDENTLGSSVIGKTTQTSQLGGEGAKMHRELAIGNFFVTLRQLAAVARDLLKLVIEQERGNAR